MKRRSTFHRLAEPDIIHPELKSIVWAWDAWLQDELPVLAIAVDNCNFLGMQGVQQQASESVGQYEGYMCTGHSDTPAILPIPTWSAINPHWCVLQHLPQRLRLSVGLYGVQLRLSKSMVANGHEEVHIWPLCSVWSCVVLDFFRHRVSKSAMFCTSCFTNLHNMQNSFQFIHSIAFYIFSIFWVFNIFESLNLLHIWHKSQGWPGCICRGAILRSGLWCVAPFHNCSPASKWCWWSSPTVSTMEKRLLTFTKEKEHTGTYFAYLQYGPYFLYWLFCYRYIVCKSLPVYGFCYYFIIHCGFGIQSSFP